MKLKWYFYGQIVFDQLIFPTVLCVHVLVCRRGTNERHTEITKNEQTNEKKNNHYVHTFITTRGISINKKTWYFLYAINQPVSRRNNIKKSSLKNTLLNEWVESLWKSTLENHHCLSFTPFSVCTVQKGMIRARSTVWLNVCAARLQTDTCATHRRNIFICKCAKIKYSRSSRIVAFASRSEIHFFFYISSAKQSVERERRKNGYDVSMRRLILVRIGVKWAKPKKKFIWIRVQSIDENDRASNGKGEK